MYFRLFPMNKKKHKSGRDKKNLSKTIHEVPVEQLIEQGKTLIEKGKARDAIDILKLAEKKYGSSDYIRLLLYRAYLLREEQLRFKGLLPEAEVVKKLAVALITDVSQLTETDLLAYIVSAPIRDAVKASMVISGNLELTVRLNRRLACRLMLSEEWDILNDLESSHPLMRDAAPVKEAVSLMNLGKWEKALQSLKPVSRSSPYSPIRMFCKAMVLFYQEHDDEMIQVLSRIPDDFPLMPVVKSLMGSAPGLDRTAASAEQPYVQFQCLWDEPVNPEESVQNLLRFFNNRQLKQAFALIPSLAVAVFPQNPILCIQDIVELLISSLLRSADLPEDYFNLILSVLPNNDASLLVNKLSLSSSHNSLYRAGAYLSLLDEKITDEAHRAIVSSMILLKLAQNLIIEKPFFRSLKTGIDKFGTLMGISGHETDPEMLLISIFAHSIKIDPLNRQAYQFLANLPRDSRSAKDAVESVLREMSATFPDDPFPCLEMASIYYEKNAFRKAERVLEEAARRAPHDNRVMDRHALSLIISACKNLHRGKYHLASNDLEKAVQFNSKKISTLLAEKKILFDLVTHPDQIEEIILREMTLTNPIDRVRAWGLLLGEISAYGKPFAKGHVSQLEKKLSREMKLLPDLKVSDIILLLSPFPKEYSPVLPQQKIAHILLTRRPEIFRSIADAELVSTFVLLFDISILTFMVNEVQKRLSQKKQIHKLPMQFFLITVSYMTGNKYSTERYSDIIPLADQKMQKELESLSHKLSRHANGYLLKTALEHFSFSDLEDFSLSFDDDDENDDFYEDMEELADFLQSNKQLITDELNKNISLNDMDDLVNKVEAMVDEFDIRGKSDRNILELRTDLLSKPKERIMFDMLAELMKDARLPFLSREGRLLLFGKVQEREQLKLF